jgi:RNA recognition motif-containing protein
MLSNSLFVTNLPFDLTEADLLPLFVPFGVVTRLTLSAEQSATVIFSNIVAAETAITHLDGIVFLGNKLM